MDTLDLFSHLYPNERKSDCAPALEKRIQHTVYPPITHHNSISSFSETVATKVESSFPVIPISAEKTNIEEENGCFLIF